MQEIDCNLSTAACYMRKMDCDLGGRNDENARRDRHFSAKESEMTFSGQFSIQIFLYGDQNQPITCF